MFSNLLTSWFLINLSFFLPQIAQLDTNMNIFSLVPLTLRIFVGSVYLTTDTIFFRCFCVVYSTAFLAFLNYFFMSLYSLVRLFTEKNSSWLIYEWIKALQVKSSVVFNFYLSILLIALYYRASFFFLLMIELYLF